MKLNPSLRRRLVLLATTTLLATMVLADATDVTKLEAKLPNCAVECLATGAKKQGCSSIDIECQCNHLEALIRTTSPCLVKAGCDLDDISEVANFVAKICADQIANLTSSETTSTPTPTGAASNLPMNLAWVGVAAAMAAGAAVL